METKHTGFVTARINGKSSQIEIVRKVNVGLHTTHNGDGRFQKMWALGVDGSVYCTRSRTGGYRKATAKDIPPPALFES